MSVKRSVIFVLSEIIGTVIIFKSVNVESILYMSFVDINQIA